MLGSDRDVEILLRICQCGDRALASHPAPGQGLALAGVGYSLGDEAKDQKKGLQAKKSKHGKAFIAGEVPACMSVDCSPPGVQTAQLRVLEAVEPAKRHRIDHTISKFSDVETMPGQTVVPNILSGHSDAPAIQHSTDSAARETVDSTSGQTNVPTLLYTDVSRVSAATSKYFSVSSSGDWEPFRHELVSCDTTKQFYPQRAFTFDDGAPDILLDQWAGDVGMIVWDAEVLLAHYLVNHNHCELSGRRVLELGAGTALAAIASYRRGASICVQELEHVIKHTEHCLRSNNVHDFLLAAHCWGDEMVQQTTEGQQRCFDLVVMADVLYHTDDFEVLIKTITECVKSEGGDVIIFYEERRKNIDTFFDKLSSHFREDKVTCYIIEKAMEESNEEQRFVKFYAHHFCR